VHLPKRSLFNKIFIKQLKKSGKSITGFFYMSIIGYAITVDAGWKSFCYLRSSISQAIVLPLPGGRKVRTAKGNTPVKRRDYC